MFLAINALDRVATGDFESVPVRDRISRASFDALAAQNAPVVVDVEHIGISLGMPPWLTNQSIRFWYLQFPSSFGKAIPAPIVSY